MRFMEWLQSSWKQWSLIMKKSAVSRTLRFAYFQILCYALEGCARTHNQIMHGKTHWRGSRFHHNTELWTRLTESRWNSSGIFSQDSPHCSSATKSKNSCPKTSDQPEEFKGRIIFMSMFNDISWGSQDNEEECESTANFVSKNAWRFSPGRWSFFGPGSEKKCILLMIANHKGNGTESLNWWW